MLQHPPAHRRVVRPRTPRANRARRTPQHRLFLGLGLLPASHPTYCEQLSTGEWVLLARYGSDYGEIAADYAYNPHLPGWMGERIYRVVGAVSPAADPGAFQDTRWWDDAWPVEEPALLTLGQLAADLAGPGRRPLVEILDPYAPGGLGTLTV